MDIATMQELALLGSIIFSLIITLLILSYIAVGLRLWVRYRITRSPGWDDAAMVASLVLFSAYCGFILAIACQTRDMKHKPYNEDEVRLSLIVRMLSQYKPVRSSGVIRSDDALKRYPHTHTLLLLLLSDN